MYPCQSIHSIYDTKRCSFNHIPTILSSIHIVVIQIQTIRCSVYVAVMQHQFYPPLCCGNATPVLPWSKSPGAQVQGRKSRGAKGHERNKNVRPWSPGARPWTPGARSNTKSPGAEVQGRNKASENGPLCAETQNVRVFIERFLQKKQQQNIMLQLSFKETVDGLRTVKVAAW